MKPSETIWKIVEFVEKGITLRKELEIQLPQALLQ